MHDDSISGPEQEGAEHAGDWTPDSADFQAFSVPGPRDGDLEERVQELENWADRLGDRLTDRLPELGCADGCHRGCSLCRPGSIRAVWSRLRRS